MVAVREQIDLLWTYVRGMWRFRWYGLAVAWLVAAFGWYTSMQIPDQYRASARVHINTESVLEPLMRGLVIQSNVEQRAQLMTRTLLSRPNLEEIARQSDLDLQADTPAAFNRIVNQLESRLRLSSGGRDNIYQITYGSNDPQKTRDVVQAALDLMIEESLGRSRDDSDSATRFLDRKIEEYRARMDQAEQRRIEFRREHAAELAATGGDFYNRLQEHRGQLEQARFELEQLQRREQALERQLEGETPVFGIMTEEGGTTASVETPELDQKIEQISQELDDLLVQYTENHPRVSSLEEQLERYTREREEKRRRLAEARAEQSESAVFTNPSLEQNPVHQEIRSSLARVRGEIAGAQARVEQYERQVEQLQQRLDTAPEVEARFRELTEEYESIKRTHDELVERRKTAEISGEVDRSEDQMEFQVIEPPRLPDGPVAPNRPLLITASMGAALAGYGALNLLLALIWPAFYSRSGVYEALRLPVLGNIERVRTPRARKRWWTEMALYALAIAGLLFAYGVMMGLALGYF